MKEKNNNPLTYQLHRSILKNVTKIYRTHLDVMFAESSNSHYYSLSMATAAQQQDENTMKDEASASLLSLNLK